MRKTILLILFLLLMVNCASAFAGGAGTAANPWQVSTVTHLQAIGTNTTTKAAHYIQVNDIDASATSTWNSGAGFVPIDTFTGNYNGQDYNISGLYINRPLTNYIGLFGRIGSGGVVRNLGVISASVTGQGDVGILAGRSTQATISRCYTTGTASGGGSVGGLIGVSNDNVISNTFSRANVANSGSISGGLCASVAGGGLTNSYSTGTVTGIDYKGGFVGYAISNPPITNCYWDTQTSGISTSAAGTGKTTAQMKTQSTFVNWDFNNIWRMEGYPVLSPADGFYLYPGNQTISVTAPPLLHSITLDMFRYGTYSYDITVSQDPTYTEIVYNVDTIAQYPMSNHTRTISLNAGEYWMTVQAKDSSGNVLETLTREFEISQTFNLGTTSAAGAVFELVSGVQTPVNGATITIYNDTFSNNYVTGTTGYYQFTGLAAGSTYYITAKKNGYDDSSLNVLTPSAGQTVTKNIIMQKEEAPTYIMPHYVQFYVTNFFTWYEGVTVTVYEDNSATPYDSDTTGADGAVGFELSESVRYRITAVDSSRNINIEHYVTPTDTKYYLVPGFSWIGEPPVTEGINYAIQYDNINLTTGYINASYIDSTATYTGAVFNVYSEELTLLDTYNLTENADSLNMTISTSNSPYIAELIIYNTGLDSGFISYKKVIDFNYGIREEFDFGWDAQWKYQLVAAVFILLIGFAFSFASAHIAALMMVLADGVFIWMGWVPRETGVLALVMLASVLAVIFLMRKQEVMK